MHMRLFSSASLLASFIFAAGAGSATTIPVANGNFQTTPGGLAYSQYTYGGSIPGWSFNGLNAGQWNPYTAAFPSADGVNIIAYSNGPTIYQTVAATVQAGGVYTLTVDLGARLDPCCGFDGSADLLINGNRYLATGTSPTRGTFSTYTATYIGRAADAGDPITIELTSTGGQGDYDNVTLTQTNGVSPVPEPASLVYVGTGGLALVNLLRTWRAKRKDTSS